MSEKKKTMRAVIEIIIAVLVIIAVYFIIRGMDRHDVRIQQAATENETQRVWKEFQDKTVSNKLCRFLLVFKLICLSHRVIILLLIALVFLFIFLIFF